MDSVVVHDFRIFPYGPLSSGFRRALRRLSERGFCDKSCAVVKTGPGRLSGVTHAGGRYVDSSNPYAGKVLKLMREQGLKPPELPFVVVPGEVTLYHEWGHHIDATWSGDDYDLPFSTRWFSHYYKLEAQHGGELPDDAIVLWHSVATELFANLFEDWMRRAGNVGEHEHPSYINMSRILVDETGNQTIRVEFMSRADADRVRGETCKLFEDGLGLCGRLPELRSDFLGRRTSYLVRQFRQVMERAREECKQSS